MSDSSISFRHLIPTVNQMSTDYRRSSTVRRQEVPQTGNVLPQSRNAEYAFKESMESIKTIADYIQNVSRELTFQIDKISGRTVITVVDNQTKEIVRQIPSEQMISLAHYFSSYLPGTADELVDLAQSFSKYLPDSTKGLLREVGTQLAFKR